MWGWLRKAWGWGKKWKHVLIAAVWLLSTVLLTWWVIDRLPEDGKGKAEWLRGIGFFLAGVGIAPLGLWLAHHRTMSLSGQTENESARRITDAFTQAVELLGHKSTAVRQGGIYALGRIAHEHNGAEHPKIMDIVAAYIRDRSKKYIDKERKEGEAREAAIERIAEKDPMPIDLEAAVSVIRERFVKFDREPKTKRGYIFDLSNSFLFNADFSRTSLKGVNLSDCRLHGCVFVGTSLVGSNLAKSNFKKADVEEATFNAANIGRVDLREAQNLTQQQVDSAIGDEDTKLPEDIKRPEKWVEQAGK